MPYSSGTRGLFAELSSWVAAIAIVSLSVVYYDEIKGAFATAFGAPVTSGTDRAAADEAEDQDAARKARQQGAVEIKAGDNGHFHAEVEVNGRPVEVMVDTGASLVALTYEDAERAGIYVKDSDFDHGVRTANGIARIALVTLDRVAIGNITLRNVQGAVSEPGKLTKTLLGMSFLSRLSRFDMRSGTLVLQE